MNGGRARMNCGSCHYKLLPESNNCRQPGLAVEERNTHAHGECARVDLETAFM